MANASIKDFSSLAMTTTRMTSRVYHNTSALFLPITNELKVTSALTVYNR